MSASAGCSRASWRPSSVRTSLTLRAEDVAVGAREVDVLEDAVRERLRRERLDRSHAVPADHEHFAGSTSRTYRRRSDRARRSPSRRPGPRRGGRATSGRKPCGSRTAISSSCVSTTSENAPLTCVSASTSASSTSRLRAREEVQRSLRCRWWSGRSIPPLELVAQLAALTRLPLWQMPTWPWRIDQDRLRVLDSLLSPAVE